MSKYLYIVLSDFFSLLVSGHEIFELIKRKTSDKHAIIEPDFGEEKKEIITQMMLEKQDAFSIC